MDRLRALFRHRPKHIPPVIRVGERESFGLRGYLDLELVDAVTGERQQFGHLNTLTANMPAAIAAVVGEMIDSGLIPTYIAAGTGKLQGIPSASKDSSAAMTSAGRYGIKYTTAVPDGTYVIDHVLVWMQRVGSGADTIYIEATQESAGTPSGSVVANGTTTAVPFNNLTSGSFGWVTFTFATPISVVVTSGAISSGGVALWFVIRTSGYVYSAAVHEVDVGLVTAGVANVATDIYAGSWSTQTPDVVSRLVGNIQATSTVLIDEVARKEITSKSSSGAVARFVANFLTPDANDKLWEFAMFDAAAGGHLLALFTQDITKTSAQFLNAYWSITFSNSP